MEGSINNPLLGPELKRAPVHRSSVPNMQLLSDRQDKYQKASGCNSSPRHTRGTKRFTTDVELSDGGVQGRVMLHYLQKIKCKTGVGLCEATTQGRLVKVSVTKPEFLPDSNALAEEY